MSTISVSSRRGTETTRRLATTLLVLLAVGVAAGAAAGVAPTDAADATEVSTAENATSNQTLTVVSYNDIQTAASNPTAMGRLVGTVNERRAAHDNPTIVIGGGDQVSPNSLSPVSNWTVPVGSLNTLDPAAEVIGNHDLDFGFEPVDDFAAASDFPWLMANVVTENGETIPGTKNYTVVNRGGVEVGIVGLADGAIKPKTAVDFDKAGYDVADYNQVGSRIATDLKENHGVDVVIAAAHIGIPESKNLANNTENIDVIVTGDDELVYPPQETSGAIITEAGGNAAFVGELNLTVSDDDVSMDSGRLIEIGANATVNETVRDYVNDSRGSQLSTVAGNITTEMDSTSANYAGETAWGNVITDSFRAKTGAEVAMTNAGGIRGDFTFGQGPVTYDDIYTSLPFGNTLVTKEMTGAQLDQYLASEVTTLESGTYGAQPQLQVSGITYEYVPHDDATDIVQDVHVNGEPISPTETYNVTVNSYMAGGPQLENLPTVGEDLTLYGTAAVDYIENNAPLSPEVEGRIQRVDSTAESVSVSTSGSTYTVTAETSEDFAAINGTVYVTAPGTSTQVEATSASFDGDDTLTATFDNGSIQSLANETAADQLELYTEYDSTEYQMITHDHPRFNADIAINSVGPTLPGESTPAKSIDSDPLLEDINGDGEANMADVRSLLDNRNAPVVQNNPTAFDFNGDGNIDIYDVVALYNEISN